MAAHQVQKRLRKWHGIVFIERIHPPFERFRRNFPGEKIERRLAQRIVHHAVKRIAQTIAAHLAIADLVRRILPHLAEHERILALLARVFAQLAQVIHRQFVGHIEPPARASGAQPVPHDGILVGEEIAPHAVVLLVQFRQVAEPPPAFIIVRPVVEQEPVEPLRLAAVPCGDKIRVHRARMAEHAVENDTNPALFRSRAQRGKIRLVAQQRIDAHPVGRIIAMVARRLKAGVEIDRRHTETFQIRQLFSDAPQASAIKIQRLKIARLRVGAIGHGRLPCKHVAASRAVQRVFVLAEAIGENLIKHRPARPIRRAERGIIRRNLERARAPPYRRALAAEAVLGVAIPEKLPLRPDVKIVPDKARRFRQRQARPIKRRVVLFGQHIIKMLLAIPYAQEYLVGLFFFVNAQPQGDLRAAGLRAGRRAIKRLPAVMIAVHRFSFTIRSGRAARSFRYIPQWCGQRRNSRSTPYWRWPCSATSAG